MELAKSWITPEIAEQALLRRVDAQQGREAICQKGNRDCAGILFPFYFPEASNPHAYRLRRDNPDWKRGKDGTVKPDKKYLGEPGAANRLYFPPGISLTQLDDPTIPIVIVEGEKKTLALQRLSIYESETPRFLPVGLSGVWNWRGVTGKASGPNGERVDTKGPINDLDRLSWADRTVYVLFDADVETNSSVMWARTGIARELASRKASVKFINIPKDSGVKGIDDLLAAWGPARVLELFENPAPGAALQASISPQFRSRPEGMFRFTTKGEQVVETQLTSYRAEIVRNTRLDDGVGVVREFEIEAALFGRITRFTISAAEFTGMAWPIEKLGSAAITYPRQTDYARAAIQSCSLDAEERSVYTHTGWRLIDHHWVYLHSRGAISQTDVDAGVSVRLPRSLAQYELRAPSTPEALICAVRASLRFIAPAICIPLRAATFRAVFGHADFSLHLVGETGAFKSELAALEQQFFGPAMDRRHLPGAWSSTPNALETLAFHAKDALLVIDDFAPQGSPSDSARLQSAADRILRAAGNGSGRARLDSNANLRDCKPPRGLILSTGEDIPRGHSIRARLLILEIEKGVIESAKLAECQKAAQAGMYSEAMAGFIRWIAGDFEKIRERMLIRVSQLRNEASRSQAHARTPEIVANLQAAFENYLEFAEASGSVDSETRAQKAAECWAALLSAVAGQAKHQAVSEPAARYIELLRSCLSSGAAHLASPNGGAPELLPIDCGWRCDASGNMQARGRCVGWADKSNVYLEPTAAYEVVQLAARNAGEVMPVAEHTLRKRLREKGYLASTDETRETLTVRRKIYHFSKNVLHLHRTTLLSASYSEGQESEDTEQ